MKILHILDHSIPLHSGYTFRTRSILKEQHKLGIATCHVTSPKHGNDEVETEVVDGLKFYRSAPISGLMSILPVLNQMANIAPMVKRILEVIDIEKPDVIHAHSPALNGLAALKAGRKSGLPVVYEIRAFWEDAAVDHGTCKEDDLRYRLTRKMETHVVKHADAVTTICQGLKSDLIARGFKKEKFTVIANAVNIEQFDIIKEKNSELEQELGLADCQVLGFLGSFYGYEGLDLLIAALPEVLIINPKVRLLLVGGGPQEQRLKQQVILLGLEGKVIFTGRVPHNEVGNYYSLVDLLVYPRKKMRLTELVTPLKPLEAMAQGKLVLASDVGGHKELITDNENGFLFEADNMDHLAQRIIDILSANSPSFPDANSPSSSSALVEDLDIIIKNGRNYVENTRNWKNSVSNYLPLYQEVIDNKTSIKAINK
ncbi:MAG: glycosyltransferase, exosortase A system-associated [Colwellia sp.]|nr:glycosyltransferase, exosortase A system-associated [Colwellia sp.]